MKVPGARWAIVLLFVASSCSGTEAPNLSAEVPTLAAAPESAPTTTASAATRPESAELAPQLLDAVGETIEAFVEPSLALDDADLAVVAWVDTEIHILRCLDPVCAEVTQATPAGSGLGTPVIQIDSQDRPALVYNDVNDQRVMFLGCDNPSCSSATREVLPFARSASAVGFAFDQQDRPTVVASTGSLELVRCLDSRCIPGQIEHTVLIDEGVNPGIALALDAEGNPVIAYGTTAGELRLLRCEDPSCTLSQPSDVAIEDVTYKGVLFGGSPEVELDDAGRAVILAPDSGAVGNGAPKLVRCADEACDAATAHTLPGGRNGNAVALDLDPEGNPVAGFNDNVNDHLILVPCNDPSCTPEQTEAAIVGAVGDLGGSVNLRLDASGNPVIVHLNIDDFPADVGVLHMQRCADRRCEKPLR